MNEFKVYVVPEKEKRHEFFRKLQEHYTNYYRYPYYRYTDPEDSKCYLLENKRKAFLKIEELNDCIVIQVISNSKRSLKVLKKFLKTV
jgi:hypothetical protein